MKELLCKLVDKFGDASSTFFITFKSIPALKTTGNNL